MASTSFINDSTFSKSARRLYPRMSRFRTSPGPRLKPLPSTISKRAKVSTLSLLIRHARNRALLSLSYWYKEEAETENETPAGTTTVDGSRPRK